MQNPRTQKLHYPHLRLFPHPFPCSASPKHCHHPQRRPLLRTSGTEASTLFSSLSLSLSLYLSIFLSIYLSISLILPPLIYVSTAAHCVVICTSVRVCGRGGGGREVDSDRHRHRQPTTQQTHTQHTRTQANKAPIARRERSLPWILLACIVLLIWRDIARRERSLPWILLSMSASAHALSISSERARSLCLSLLVRESTNRTFSLRAWLLKQHLFSTSVHTQTGPSLMSMPTRTVSAHMALIFPHEHGYTHSLRGGQNTNVTCCPQHP